MTRQQTAKPNFVSTRNACKLCAPLGAALVFRGIEGAVPFLHGSQGCATYIRRYLISHFREPMDVASSSFSETSAIFGGGENLHAGLSNVLRQYQPALIGIASTCLSETIGDDLPMLLRQYRSVQNGQPLPALVAASTPSYRGTHMDGFHAAVQAVVSTLAEGGERGSHVNLLPGFASPADLRHLKEILQAFALPHVLLPDYADTLDGPAWDEHQKIPSGGTPLSEIRSMGRACATIELGRTLSVQQSAAEVLRSRFGVPAHRIGLPIGVGETDQFMALLEQLSGRPAPTEVQRERGRLIDAYVDGHKYFFGKRAIVYGEEDLVVAVASFLAEIGIVPVLCASGGESGRLHEALCAVAPNMVSRITVRQGIDFLGIAQEAADLAPDLLIGSSKGYPIARDLKVPLVRVGFPIHDRIGAQRIAHLGYRGTQQLYDRIVNALLEHKQSEAPTGYSYL